MNTRTDDKLLADAAQLNTAIAPQRDLWPDIERAIELPAPRRRFPYLAQAAAVLLIVATSSLLTYSLTRQAPTIVEVAVPVNEGLALEPAAFGGNHELGDGFRLARNNLKEQLDHELARLSPESREGVEHNLVLIRTAIGEINAALAEEPGNILLQDLLLKTYREELAVMRKVGGLTQSVMSRNDI